MYEISDYDTGEIIAYVSRKADAVALLSAADQKLIVKKMKKS